MKYKPVSPALFVKNRKKLAEKLLPKSLVLVGSNDLMPRNGDQFHPFRQNSDMFYLSGIDQEKSILIMCPDHPIAKFKEILFVIKTSKEIEIWEGHKLSKEKAKEISGISSVYWIDEMEIILKELILHAENIYLNLNEYPKFFTEVKSYQERLAKRIRDEYPLHSIKRLAPIITKLRLIKESEETDLIQHACDITEKTFYRILQFLKPGLNEYEIEAEMTHEFMMNRANGHAYQPIVASGANACVLHYVENNKQCESGDLLLLDFGAEYANYASDCSRTIPINGKFSPRQKEIYEAVLRVFKQAIPLMVVGKTINRFHKEVCKIMDEELINLGLYSKEDRDKQDASNPLYTNYYMHGTSHFIGLDVHDVGGKIQNFEPGMILSCEPGIYIKDEGIGIRLENDILITKDQPKDLMASIPIEIEEIEYLMRTKS